MCSTTLISAVIYQFNTCAMSGKYKMRSQLHSEIAYQLFSRFLIRFLLISSKNPVLDAEMATPCGHSFCGFCVECFKTNGIDKVCQKCRRSVSAFGKNLFASNMLNMEKGRCRWFQEEFPLDNAKNHVRQCNQIEVPCGRCKKVVKRADEFQHQLECEERDIVCACGTRLKKKDEDEHKENWCTFLEGPCPLKCGQLVKK